jgi:hypothetical protein
MNVVFRIVASSGVLTNVLKGHTVSISRAEVKWVRR